MDGNAEPPGMGSRRVLGGNPAWRPSQKLQSCKNLTISLITTLLVPQRPIKV